MRYAFADSPVSHPWWTSLQEGLGEALMRHGHEQAAPVDPGIQVAFHPVSPSHPQPFPRKHRATFSIGATALATRPERLIPDAYPLLIRSISNALVVALEDDPTTLWVITPELGCYPVSGSGARELFENLYDRLVPLATSHLVIDNRFDPDLPEPLWQGTPATEEMSWTGRAVASWGLLPTPFPIREVLNDEQWRHLQHLYGIGGLSYGNFSIRHDETRFWMSASGVDKANLREIGRDILLVKGFDEPTQCVLLSVPPGVKARRVSVDAIEHHMIYRTLPQVRAMVHLHAWVTGVPVTRMNYPCGTVEMGHEVVGLLAAQPDPGHTVIGMRNHGITVTGDSFHEILERLEGNVLAQVPMQLETVQ